MLKLKRFLKPFLVGLTLAIALLVVQAVSELNLPNLMSSIVNVGIQQGGVEDGVPEVISEDGYGFVSTFMDEDERELLEANYELISGDDANPYAQNYPEANGKNVYALDPDIADDVRVRLAGAFGTATWTMVNLLERVQGASEDGTLEQTLAEAAQAERERFMRENPGVLTEAEQAAAAAADAAAGGDTPAGDTPTADPASATTADPAQAPTTTTPPDLAALSDPTRNVSADLDLQSTDIQNFDLSQLYELQPVLQLLPQDWFSTARDEALALDDSLRSQSSIMLTSGFYRELGRDMAALEISYILRIGLIMLLITVLSGAASVLVGYLSARIGAGVARDLRQAVYKKVVSFSHAEFDHFSTASLITRSTNDVAVIQQMLTMGIRMICYAPIMGAGGVFMALEKSVSMSWIIGVAVVVVVGIVLVLLAVVMPKFKIMQVLIDRLNLVARESLNGLMVVRAFSRTAFEEERFDEANKNLTATNLFVNRAMVFLMPVMMLFMNGLTVLIIWVGAHQVAEAQMQVGDMMAYMQYVMQIIMSFMFIAMLFVFIPRASVSAKRINEVLETEPMIVDPAQPLHMEEKLRGHVEFRNVSFHYEGASENALCDINFVAKPGQTTAFIGSTGSGKSTIINLIPRFYDVSEGEVLVGGVNVRHLKQQELRACIGYVPQRSVLMTGTVAENIAYGAEEMTADEMAKVAEVAQAMEFIEESEDGFELAIAKGGSSVSGGQRQRLSIARALAIDPDIYLFDDSFSALDFKTDTALRRALAKYTSRATMIIVAQRISTIMDADQIFVIDKGRVVGHGKHQELLRSCKEYFEIASSQLSESELASTTAPALPADPATPANPATPSASRKGGE